MHPTGPAVLLGLCLLPLGACGTSRPAAAAPPPPEPTDAIAIITPVAGHTGGGTVRFTAEAGGVHVIADVTGLSPGAHGFHIHEYGDASAADLSSLGGHFNPGHASHGGPDHPQHHAGDLGNLIAGAGGEARVDEVVSGIAITGPSGILGRSVVIHENEDDLSSQPAGNSGKRICSGVIGLAKP